ncbi:hypothetical protein SNOG_02657 [Parastagonospora nodorum SN15]|uniref:Uncharacterized protein n=1 Tax=Phaeosphaeria nodorum (strain SN15 / ATCC MYA-4574 / FGSC 10173) TaxID=321614 RepID=Q0V007_PHANO|nr:hypothetical protein SNOG_02657 [Parastagonospora nodorum SN15]EAT89388.1 hypothetical protein SNOG_02657 [Parastagonospora nodorum SN15]
MTAARQQLGSTWYRGKKIAYGGLQCLCERRLPRDGYVLARVTPYQFPAGRRRPHHASSLPKSADIDMSCVHMANHLKTYVGLPLHWKSDPAQSSRHAS